MKIDKVNLILSSVLTGTLLIWISSCRHDALIPANTPDICFEMEVLPIFQNNCSIAGCHDGSGETHLLLNSYVSINNAVTPYNPNNSRAYQAIISKFGENKMPPSGPLSLENRTIIRLWIEQGATLTTCTTPPTDTSHTSTPYVNPRACFSRDILPVLVSSCGMASCHDAITHKEGYIYTTYSTILSSVKPGSPATSKLYQVITTTSGESRMPPLPKSRLAQAQIDSIAAWIRYGALNENCGEVCDTINPITFSGTLWPIIQNSCTGCHSGSAPSGSVLLANYANVQTVAASGLLMKALKGSGVTLMPPSGSFSACRIAEFNIWVNKGYLNN